MSLQSQIHSLVLRLSDEFKSIQTKIGVLGNLSTTDRSSLTAAINELQLAIVSASAIDDAQVSNSTTWSSAHLLTRLDALKAELLGGADAAYDTLLEIQQALTADDVALAGLLAAVQARVRIDAPQSLSTAEQVQGRANLGAASAADLGDPDVDLVAIFEAALVA